MKKYILITFVAFLALSCSDKSETDNSAVQPQGTTTEQADTSQTQPQESPAEFKRAILNNNSSNDTNNERANSDSRSISVFLYLIVFLNILATVFALLYTFFVNSKVARTNSRIEQRKREIAGLHSEIDILRQNIDRLKHQSKSSSSYQSPYTPPTTPVQQTSITPKQKVSDNSVQKKEDNKKQKHVPKQATRSSKVLYLEANSDECFFQFYEQKRDTSKFVAYVIPGDMAAIFEVIDVERIRSLNTSRSIKQAGNVAIKDAQGIKEQKAGKIHKTTDDKGNEYWVIDEPVTVEFKK